MQIVTNTLGTSVGSRTYDELIAMIGRGGDVQVVRGAIFFAAYVTWGINKKSSLNTRKDELLKSMYEVSCQN